MKFYWFFLLYLLSFSSIAQQKFEYTYEDLPLDSVMHDVEFKNKVNFSFAQDQVDDKKINISALKISLDELLAVLEAQTGLEFKKISGNQIIVVPKAPIGMFCGYLLDKSTGTPISNTTALINGDSIFSTNDTGFFSLKKIKKKEFSLKVLGYEPIVFLGSATCAPIYLTPIVEQLDEVVVTGYITTGIDRKNDGSIEVTQNSLGILPGLTTADILQSIQLIPGITSLDESVSGIQIRGGSSDENLILFDDIKMFSSGYFYGMFSSFNPLSTNKATIMRSGASAAYGDKISGIIDISSGDEIPEKTMGGMGLDGLSFDGYIKTPISDKLAVYFFARRSYTDFFKNATYNGYAEKIFNNTGIVKDINGNILQINSDYEFTSDNSTNDFFFQDITSKIIYSPTERDLITVSSLITKSSLDFSFSDGNEIKLDSLITKNNGVSLKWDHRVSSKSKVGLKTYLSNHRSYYKNEENLNPMVEEINIRGNTITDFGFDLRTDHKIDEKKAYTLGYQLSHTDVKVELSKENPIEPESNYSFPSDEKNFINSIYGEYTQTLKQTGIIVAGMRIVHYDNLQKILFEPRFNFQYALTNSLSANVSFEIRNQSISQLIEFNNTELRLENNIWQLSDNSKYPLLTSHQISNGLLFDHNGLTIDLEGYYKKIKGLTSFTNGFNTPELLFSEGTSTIKGIDFLLKKKIQNYRIWLGYSFNDIRYAFPSLQTAEFPGNNDITHSLRISNSLKVANFQFSLGWLYRTGKPYTPIRSFDPDSTSVAFEPLNSGRLPIYHRLDASIIYDFEPGKAKKYRIQLGFSGLNLYNRERPISITYRTESTVDGLQLKQVIQHFSLGFTPNLQFRIFF
jgi:hypothetical protein